MTAAAKIAQLEYLAIDHEMPGDAADRLAQLWLRAYDDPEIEAALATISDREYERALSPSSMTPSLDLSRQMSLAAINSGGRPLIRPS